MAPNESTDGNLALTPKASLYWDPKQTHYAISEGDLETLQQGCKVVWKEVFFTSLGIVIACGINAGDRLPAQGAQPTWPLFLNSLFGSLGIVIAVMAAFLWRNNHKTLDSLIGKIKSQTRHDL